MQGRATIAFVVLLAIAIAGAAAWWMRRGESPPRVVDVAPPPRLDAPPAAPPKSSVEPLDDAESPADAAPQRERIVDERSVREQALVVHVLDAQRSPIAGATIGVWSAAGVLGTRACDPDGIARLPAGEGGGEALVIAPGATPWRAALDLAPGARELVAPARPEVAGTVRVDGAAPTESLRIELVSDRALWNDAGVPQALRDALGLAENASVALAVSTDADGAFSLRGLRAPLSGALALPDSLYVIAAKPATLEVERGEVRLRELEPWIAIEALALPRLRGRFVEVAGGEGARAEVHSLVVVYQGEPERRRDPPRSGAREDPIPDDEGRFACAILPPRHVDASTLRTKDDWPMIEKVAIEATRVGGGVAKTWEIAPEDFFGPWDLGELVLGEPAGRAFFVRDGAGAPIEGAVAIANVESGLTDASGRGEFTDLDPEITTVEVGKLGWRSVDVGLPRASDPPLEVKLAPANRLEIAFVDADGRPLAGERAALIADAGPFDSSDPTRPHATHVATGGTRLERSRMIREDHYRGEFRPDEQGRAVFSDLRIDLPLRVAVLDSLGGVLVEREVRLGERETKSVELRLELSTTQFAGRVVDPEGHGLHGASVSIGRPRQRQGEVGDSRVTDASGAFAFDHIEPGTIKLTVTHEGFSPLRYETFEIVEGAAPIELVLSPSIDLLVRVVDSAGEAVPAQDVFASAQRNPKLPARRRNESTFEFSSLPSELVQVTARVAGYTYEHSVDPRGGDFTLVVPAHGKALVIFHRKDREGERGVYRARILDREGTQVDALDLVERHEPRRVQFPALLPGEYAVQVAWHSQRRGARGSIEPIASAPLTVVAGETARVELRE